MKKDFIPRRNADLNSFEDNFLKKLELHSKELKLRPAETESPVKIIVVSRKAFSKMIRLKTDYAAACEEYIAEGKINFRDEEII